MLECRENAWGADELRPWSGEPSAWFNLGLTIVDSLDTLLIMGLHREAKQARNWIKQKLNLNQGNSVSVSAHRALG